MMGQQAVAQDQMFYRCLSYATVRLSYRELLLICCRQILGSDLSLFEPSLFEPIAQHGGQYAQGSTSYSYCSPDR